MAFVRVPGNPEPEGAEELWLEGRGGVKLRALFAPAIGAPRGSVILFTGRTEFVEKYFEVVGELQRRGFAVFTMDWRGQGLSGREQANALKGHLATFDDPVADLYAALRMYGDRLPKPHIVLAHSMGGCIALRAMQTNRIAADGAVFSAPMWGIANVKGFAEDFTRFMTGAGLGGMFAPGVETKWTKQSFKKNALTHDQERYARAQGLVAENAGLALAGPTLGWVTAALDAIDTFHQPGALNHLRMPIMVMSAGEEALVDNSSHAEIATLLPNARHIMIDGARHEILMETDNLRAQAWAAFDAIADAVAPRAGATAPAQQTGA
ncbi:MAG: alpha/beta hydrolase [Hyphomonadaceae bacterium]|nr:MAG: lysophospholipase [Caulobacteraceae bacterium]MBT9445994.1 alpha/beta hydrolase [Hyphomonadaceae bacterium]TPW06712.1 MAG: lysophospholipase [Alphaproteobacteria bacterium]